MSDLTLSLWAIAVLMAFWVPVAILIGLAAQGRL